MIDTGMGPVFAFCEIAMKCTFINFSIGAGLPRRVGPRTLLYAEVEGLKNWRLQTVRVEQPEHVEYDDVLFSIAGAFGAVFVLEQVFEELLRCAAVLQ
jgi:hypothetical protein